MAHSIEKNDTLILNQKKAWHGLGTILQETPTVREALPLSGLGWTVDLLPLLTEDMQSVPNAFASRRSDDSSILGVVGKDYRVFQNEQLFELAERITEDSSAQVETAGSLRGGRDAFLLLKNDSFTLGRDSDKIFTYTLLRNTHDGTASLRVLGTSVRVVCANTLGFALAANAAKDGISIRHTESMFARVDEARKALFQSQTAGYAFQAKAEALVAKPLSKEELQELFVDVYQTQNGMIPVRTAIKNKQDERKRKRALVILADWETRFNEENQQLPGIEGSAWAALNSITEWAEHGRPVRTGQNKTVQDARNHSNLFGSSAAFKEMAMAKALVRVG